MPGGGEPGHVRAGLGNDHVSSQMADPGDGADQIPETLKGFDDHLDPGSDLLDRDGVPVDQVQMDTGQKRVMIGDYHGGIKDAKKKLLRMIGDPATRYREDPVRIIRVVRFAAKLGFEIEPKTRAPIKEMAALLDNVPQSRTFDEMIKLLQTGHALASIVELKKLGLHRGVFPVLDVALDEAQRHDGREKFVQLALADTDRRVAEGKPVAPSFMLASMLWHDVLDRWQKQKAAGTPSFPALQDAIDAVFDARIGDISGRGRLAADMREIWMMQPRRAAHRQCAVDAGRAAALSRRARLPAPARRVGRGR